MNNFVIFLVTSIALIGSIIVFISGIWLNVSGKCQLVYYEIVVISGGAMLIVLSILGLFGAYYRRRRMYRISMTVLIVLTSSMLAVSIISAFVSSQGGEHNIKGSRFEEYKLDDYHTLLKSIVNTHYTWKQLKTCLKSKQVCKKLEEENLSEQQFLLYQFSPIQSGCCIPPLECGFVYKSATKWEKSINSNSSNADCGIWTETPNLCFDCHSCKAGFLHINNGHWKKFAPFDSIALGCLLLFEGAAMILFYFFFDG